jgi:hypothetical protein
VNDAIESFDGAAKLTTSRDWDRARQKRCDEGNADPFGDLAQRHVEPARLLVGETRPEHAPQKSVDGQLLELAGDFDRRAALGVGLPRIEPPFDRLHEK